MARLVPDDLDEHLSDAVTYEGERRTLLRLRDELPHELTAYHAVNLVSASDIGSVYGEIDFIVADPYCAFSHSRKALFILVCQPGPPI